MSTARTHFEKLNHGWNAEPNAPYPEIRVENQVLTLTFYLNPWAFPDVTPGDLGELTFVSCWRYRLGPTNDEGWWMRQCRFSFLAPEWGEFYKVSGNLRLDSLPPDAWLLNPPGTISKPSHHFLFYFRDETFECDAEDWIFRIIPAKEDLTKSWDKVSLPSGSSVFLVPPRSHPQRTTSGTRHWPWFWGLLPRKVRRWLSAHHSHER